MIPGFNHNIQHKGKTYHIQTEDSGLANPHIITLLYHSGTIIAKKKTSYADLVAVDRLQEVVRELMEEQHKAMLRELIKGGFDNLSGGVAPAEPVAAPVVAPATPLASPPAPEIQASEIGSLFGGSDEGEKSLDEIILSYLSDDNT